MEEQKDMSRLKPHYILLMGMALCLLIILTIEVSIIGFIVWKNQGIPVYLKNQPVQTEDETKKTAQKNIIKSEKPQVDLFVMSHCPFGLQAQKAYIPVSELLAKKADMKIKFVNYIMHGASEKDDNTIEYCIQKEQESKYLDFLKCYTFSENGDSEGCIKGSGIDRKKLDTCIVNTDKEFKINDEFNNKNNWLSGKYAKYLINEDENKKFNVKGSPTLIINGVQTSFIRSPEGLKQAVCNAFKTPPKECLEKLSSDQAGAGFGTKANTSGSGGMDCGT